MKHTNWKWLDVQQLFQRILKIQSPGSRITRIKYFTADIKARFASRGQQAQQAQQDYHRAITSLYPDAVEIIKGYHSLDSANLPIYQKPLDRLHTARVWRLEEKQTDVNIALHIYRDVMRGDCDPIVLVSNDTDLEPVLEAVREDKGAGINIGIIIPIPKPERGKPHRPANQRLSLYSDWTRRYILDEELDRSLLPTTIPTRKKPIHKPDYG